MESWASLNHLKAGEIIDLPEHSFLEIDDGVYKISEHQYLLSDDSPNDKDGRIRLLSFYWAASERSFNRVYFKDVENDDKAVAKPPEELLPEGLGSTYAQIKQAMRINGAESFLEYASYRIMSDGAFIHKVLENSQASYYFRSPDIIDNEWPCAILWKSVEP